MDPIAKDIKADPEFRKAVEDTKTNIAGIDNSKIRGGIGCFIVDDENGESYISMYMLGNNREIPQMLTQLILTAREQFKLAEGETIN